MAGQVDRFGQPIPASPGYQVILNPDGSQPQMRNILQLDSGLIAADDNDNDCTRISLGALSVGDVIQFDDVAELRHISWLTSPSTEKIYITKRYKNQTSINDADDTGAMAYRWYPDDTTTDDGVLYIKNSHFSVGRFHAIKPTDGMMNAQACGPALIDVGTITRSFDPTGTTVINTEMSRITGILRNSGWSGITFGRDYAGNLSYQLSGAAIISPSISPFQGFCIQTVQGAYLYSTTTAILQIVATGESNLIATGYSSRFWTFGSGGIAHMSGLRTATGVSDITGLSVGNICYARLGANDTDFSGICHSYAFCEIKSITPTTGNAGNVEFWQGFPEDTPDAPGNLPRQYNKHDIIKVTGFQDNVKIDCNLRNVFLSVQNYRNLTVNCTWEDATFYCINGLGGIGLKGTVRLNKSRTPSNVTAGGFITLAQQYDTHLYDLSVSMSNVEFAGAIQQIFTEEANCRGTRVDRCTIESYDSASGFSGVTQIFGITPGQTALTSIGHLIIKGGFGQIGIAGDVENLDIKNGTNGAIQMVASNVRNMVYLGRKFKLVKGNLYDYPLPVAASTTDYVLPIHGITTFLRVKPDTLTGVTDVLISGDGVNYTTILSFLTSGVWSNVVNGSFILAGYPNFPGYNAMRIRVITNGSVAAGKGIHVMHDCFVIDQTYSALSTTDTSFPSCLFSNGAPTFNSDYFGQDCFDTAGAAYYKAVNSGTGASDWKKLTP